MMAEVKYHFFRNPPLVERLENGDTTSFASEQYAFQIGLALWCTTISLFQMRSMKIPDQSVTANMSANSVLNMKKNLRRKRTYSLTRVGLLGLFTLECIAWNAPIAFLKIECLLGGLIALFVILLVHFVAFRFISKTKT